MVTGVIKMKYNPYSVSKIGTYTTCKKKFDLQYIQKIKINKPSNIALQKGSFIHKIIEEFYNYNTPFECNEIFTEAEKQKAKDTVKTFELSKLGQFYKNIAESNEIYSLHEEKFAFKISKVPKVPKVRKSRLEICDYNDKDAWIRGAIDFQYLENNIVYNIDWKSGKDKSKDETFGIDQSIAYTIFLMLKYPDINVFKSRFVFVEHCTEKEIVYTRDKYPEYIKHFYNLTKTIEKTEIFNENVTPLCDFCDFQEYGFCTSKKELESKTSSFMNTMIDF